jgi:hypothetical protein
MNLRAGGDARDWFVLAMDHWQIDHKKDAREWFNKAFEWMDKNQVKDEELATVLAVKHLSTVSR